MHWTCWPAIWRRLRLENQQDRCTLPQNRRTDPLGHRARRPNALVVLNGVWNSQGSTGLPPKINRASTWISSAHIYPGEIRVSGSVPMGRISVAQHRDPVPKCGRGAAVHLAIRARNCRVSQSSGHTHRHQKWRSGMIANGNWPDRQYNLPPEDNRGPWKTCIEPSGNATTWQLALITGTGGGRQKVDLGRQALVRTDNGSPY